MTATIVVGIDGSPTADHALTWARAFAARREAAVEAVMAWEGPARGALSARLVPSLAPTASPPATPALEGPTRASFEAAVGRAMEGPGPLTAVLRHGPTVPTVLAEAEADRADLIVVGTRGLGPIRRALLGSVSARVARDSPTPVAVVPLGAPTSPSAPVVVGVDGSVGSVAALRWAAAESDGGIHAVHVMEWPFGPEYAVEGLTFVDHESFGRELVERTIALAIGERRDVSIGVTSGDPRDVLPQVAVALRASMVVVGARGGHGLVGLGSVVTTVASTSDVTVVVVPPGAEGAR